MGKKMRNSMTCMRVSRTMKMKYLSRNPHKSKKTPLWKWLVIIFLVIAMPLFFSFVRNVQIQNALTSNPPESQKMQQGQKKDARSISY